MRNIAQQVLNVIYTNRAVGNTFALILSMLDHEDVHMVVRSHDEGKQLARQYNIDPLRFIALHNLENFMRGRKAVPLVFDVSVITELLKRYV